MTNDPAKAEAVAVDESAAAAVSSPDAHARPAAASSSSPRPSLKDRIADLQLASKATAARATIADRVKAVQDAAPAAAEIKDRLKGAAAAVRLDKINRETLKAGRDGLAAKVEALLKPRPVQGTESDVVRREPLSPPGPAAAAVAPPMSVGGVKTVSETTAAPPTTPTGRRDVSALRARVEDALKSKTTPQIDDTPIEEPSARPTPIASHVADVPITSQRSNAPSASRTTETSPAKASTAIAPSSTQAVATPITGRLASIKSRLTQRRNSDASQDDTRATTADASVISAPSTQEPTAVAARDMSVDPSTVRSRGIETVRIVKAEAEAERSRPIFSLGLLATALTAGGVLHILTTFAVPWANVGSAFERLRWQLEPNAMRVFAADANGQTPLPFLTADMRYAMCRYDLTSAPVQVAAQLPDIGWSLALYTPQGDNFYAVPGQDGRVVTAQFTLNTASDRLLLPVPGVRRSDTDAAQVTSPAREGLIVLRAPNLGPAQQSAIDDVLKRATCRAVARR